MNTSSKTIARDAYSKAHKIDWSKVKKVFFDLDGTLLDLHFDNYFWLEYLPIAYARKNKRTDIDVVKQELMQRILAKKGTLDWYCLDYWSATLELDIISLKKRLQHKIQPLPYAMDFLQLLKQHDIELWLTTNAHRAGLNLKLENVDIQVYFSKIISSHDFNHAKEHTQFWRKLKDQHEYENDEVLFIDDTLSVLEAVQGSGIKQLVHILKPDSKKHPTEKSSSAFSQIENLLSLTCEYTAYLNKSI